MTKTYKLHPFSFFFLGFCIIILFVDIFIFKEKNKFLYYLGIYLIPFLSLLTGILFLGRIRIEDKGVRGYMRYIPVKGRYLEWSEINFIDDDHFLFAHMFRLFPHMNPEGTLVEKMRDVGDAINISNFIKNYDDLLREILIHCRPGTKTEQIVLHQAKMTWEQVETERRKFWANKE